MTTRIGKVFTFEAAHHLPLHDGKCQRPHGHTYRVEVTFLGDTIDVGPKHGMVYDFGDIAAVWKEELEPLLDHRDLNETAEVEETTAELLAEWIYSVFYDRIAAEGVDVVVESVRVWETSNAWAEYPA